MEAQVFTFANSPFVPVTVDFFGLSTGDFICGGQAFFVFPKKSPEVNRTLVVWDFWMPRFMQFLTGLYLLTGLTWFNTFGKRLLYTSWTPRGGRLTGLFQFITGIRPMYRTYAMTVELALDAKA